MSTNVEYKKSLTLQDNPKGISWVEQMGRTRWEIHLEIYSGDTLCSKGVQKGCFWDMNLARPTFVPQVLQDAFAAESQQ